MRLFPISLLVAAATLPSACDDGTAPPNAAPTAAFTAGCEQLECTFANNSTDTDGTIEAYAWDFGDGWTGAERAATHTYAPPGGQFTVTLTVTDDDEEQATAAQQVDVRPDNQSPLADFEASCVNLTCSFIDQSTDPDADVLSHAWDFGDGQTSTEPNPTHTYVPPGGRLAVALIVTDDDGESARAVQQVNVAPPLLGGQIAFGRDGRIYQSNTDGGGLVELSEGPDDSWPAWSPDGSRLAFTRIRGGAPGIFVMNADGSNVIQRATSGANPTWSPDGEWIAYVCAELRAVCKVEADDVGTDPVTIYTDADYDLDAPAWSPNGAHIAFAAGYRWNDYDWLDIWDIWIVGSDGSSPTVLDAGQGYDMYQPAWSPDGGRIAHVACLPAYTDCSRSAIVVTNAKDTRASSRVWLADASGFARPTWSRNGQVIVFESSSAIEWVSADGSRRAGIIGDGQSPAWRP